MLGLQGPRVDAEAESGVLVEANVRGCIVHSLAVQCGYQLYRRQVGKRQVVRWDPIALADEGKSGDEAKIYPALMHERKTRSA